MGMMVRTLMAMSGLLLALILIWPLIRRHVQAGARFAICVLVLIGLLVPVRFSVPVRLPERARRMPIVQTVIAPQAAARAASAPVTQPQSASTTPVGAPPVSPMRAAMVLWALGALAVLGIGIARHARLLRHVRRRAVPGGEAGGMCVFYLDSRFSPFVIGWRRPRLILPVGYRLTELVLRHEQIHVRRGDALFRMLLLVVRALHWWNPLAWLFARIANEECELSCDALALRGASEAERQDYAWRVLEAAGCGVPASALSSNWGGGKRRMKQRLMSIVQPGRERRGYALVALALILVLCAGSVLAEPAENTDYDTNKLVVGDGAVFYRMSDLRYNTWLRRVNPDDESSDWELDPDAKLIDGWRLDLVQVKCNYTDTGGKRQWVKAAVVIAVPTVANPRRHERVVKDALNAGVVHGEPNIDIISREIGKAIGEYGIKLVIETPEDVILSFVCASDEIDRITDIPELAWQRQRAYDEVPGLEVVQDPREITMVPTAAELKQLFHDYAGRQVIVEFANGSLWWFHDKALVCNTYGYELEDGYAYLRINFKLISLTQLDPSDVRRRADKLFNGSTVKNGLSKEELKAELFPVLCREFGIDESEADTCFELIYFR